MMGGKAQNWMRAAGVALTAVAAVWLGASGAQAQTVMKLSTATINDTQHEYLKRFVAIIEKESGGKIKGEIYPASQLGAIPRQIEGVQFGSIQGWMGPPEFLVGIDERFEALTAPGLFKSIEHVGKVMNDPEVRKLIFPMGEAKGLTGVGFAAIGPSSILMRKPIKTLADIKGSKIRVLASPFQLELIRRMDANPIAMTLADVLPGLQQGTIDGTLTALTIYTTMRYDGAAKHLIKNDQPFVNSFMVMSKRWMDGLPADQQKIIRDAGIKVSEEIRPYLVQFFDEQIALWKSRGGEYIDPPKEEFEAVNKKILTIGDDLSKSKPGLNATVKALFAAAEKHK